MTLARRAIDLIGSRAEIVLTAETRAALGTVGPSVPLEELDADALVVLGGDGTILYTLQRSRIPILPINAGTVGFLAEIDGENPKAFEGAVERLLRGAYHVEDRMKLASSIGRVPLPDATNEVVVHTGQVAKMRLFEILVDRRPVGRLRADGVIVATSTGSTSYALSALGPIVDPSIEGILVAALAPFQSTQRAVLIDPLRIVGVRLVQEGKDGVVVVDGQEERPVAGGATVTVYRSPRRSSFIRLGGSFFRRLQGKQILPWNQPAQGPEALDADLPPTP
ncbi:MAG: NAD(+)/NADH kinase [Thermoplasmata archaeon]|nr:NAD(+)/NADH kinase [Thermoplasmata archaeon]MCI4359420.1 NAD(+)/NADH kinase [Thermoplasmata archaeon]